jgi:hypothetical protein
LKTCRGYASCQCYIHCSRLREIDRTTLSSSDWKLTRLVECRYDMIKLPRALVSCKGENNRGCLPPQLQYEVSYAHSDSISISLTNSVSLAIRKCLCKRSNMYKYTLAVLANAGLGYAQDSDLDLFLLGFTSQSIVGSIITSVSYTKTIVSEPC